MRLSLVLTIFSSILHGLTLNAQNHQSGNLFTRVTSFISSMPGDTGSHYQDPSPAQLATWENILSDLFAGNYSDVESAANTLDYTLVQFTDTNFTPPRVYYMLRRMGNNYWGTYVYYPEHCRKTVIQSPHPKRDANTGHQGIHVFRETESMFYMVSGTHRCNSNVHSLCTGTTSACSGMTEPFRLSDLAHTTTSIFQKTTQYLFEEFNETHFIQLHGFSKLATDPYVILSNGTQVTPSPDHISTFAAKLDEADTSLTFKIAHIDTGWNRLRGFGNTQGRMINQSPDACNTNATNSIGRFFHVEQEKSKLRDDVTGWNKIAYALDETFECEMEPSVISSNNTPFIHVHPNPSSNSISISFEDLDNTFFTIHSVLGKELLREEITHQKAIVDVSNWSEGIYVISSASSHIQFVISRP